MADSRERVLHHGARALEELAALAGVALELLAEHTPARAHWLALLRAEEKRWRARAPSDAAAARVAEVFGALADLFEPPARESARAAPRDTERKFDPPRVGWDTPARWRS
jgi:hypothetical protein